MAGRGDNNKSGSAGRGASNQSNQPFGQTSDKGKSNKSKSPEGKPSEPQQKEQDQFAKRNRSTDSENK